MKHIHEYYLPAFSRKMDQYVAVTTIWFPMGNYNEGE